MEKETKRMLKIIEENDGYNCGYCEPCRTIEKKIDGIINRLKRREKNHG